jgi:hypothetical protein
VGQLLLTSEIDGTLSVMKWNAVKNSIRITKLEYGSINSNLSPKNFPKHWEHVTFAPNGINEVS